MRATPFVVLLLLTLPAALLPAASARDGPPAWQAPYSTEPVALECGLVLPLGECPDVPGPNVQFGPFADPPASVDVLLADESGRRVGARLVFYDADGRELGRGELCERARKHPAPEGTAYLRVLVDTVLTPQHCPHVVPTTTLGTVTLRLRD